MSLLDAKPLDHPRSAHAWPSRHYPLSIPEEAAFLADLIDRVRTTKALIPSWEPPKGLEPEYHKIYRAERRRDLTVLITALRSGCSLADVADWTPGADFGGMLTAYRFLELRRAQSVAAWRAIEAEPTTAALYKEAEIASLLLPAHITRLDNIAQNRPQALPQAIDQVSLAVESTIEAAEAVFERILSATDLNDKVELGLHLFNPAAPSLWWNPSFLPSRVTEIHSVRIQDLIGEKDAAGQRRVESLAV